MTLSFAFLFPEGKDVPWAATVKPMGMAMLGGHGRRRRRLAAASNGCTSAAAQPSSSCLSAAADQQPVTWGRAVGGRASQHPAGFRGRDGRLQPVSAARPWRAGMHGARTAMAP